ncbi:S-norcoclaurine synthase 2-like [Papaver somniferum]|uniref:S-norcoclaurine synthase 2-like n=1 Tax=Papaver somniferum TaxID=3469 RepID=UPI000E703C1C|nr:S-norcoclaurine synthase 2-like [Papaver somniferum]
MNALPGMFEKIEILEGDGGVGTVLRIIYPEGSVPLTNEEKFVTMDDCKRLKEILQTKEGYLDMGVTYYMETFKIIECGNSSIIQSIVEYKAPEEVAAKVSSLISVEGLFIMAKIVAKHVLMPKASPIAA